jgi:hypothetical protein
MIAHEHELLGKAQGAKACWQSDLRGFVYNAIIKNPARE